MKNVPKYDSNITLTHVSDILKAEWSDRIRRNRKGELEVMIPAENIWRPLHWSVRCWIAQWFHSIRHESVTPLEVGRAMEAGFPLEWSGRDVLRAWTKENTATLEEWGRLLDGDVLAIRPAILREALGRTRVSQILDEAECDGQLVHNARRRDYQVWTMTEEEPFGKNVRYLAFRGASDLLDADAIPQ